MSDSEFTLEKFEVDKRLRAVENQLAVLVQAVNDLKDTKSNMYLTLQDKIERNTILLDGVEGRPGLIVRLDRLEQLKLWLGVLYGAFISAVAAEIMHYLVTLHRG